MICRIHEEKKNITILVSHNMNDIARLCDRVLVIEKGKLAMNGTVREVFSRGDELEAMGLSLPDGALIARRLREAGVEVPGAGDEAHASAFRSEAVGEPLTLEEVADAIATGGG